MVTDFFEVVTGVIQGDKLVPYLFIICPDYLLAGYCLHPAETMTNVDYLYDQTLLANTSAHTNFLMHSLKL